MRLIGKGSKIPWIYVGASMRDTDLTTVFNRKEFAEGVHEIWVSPYLPPTVHEFAQVHRGNIWSKKEDLHSHSVTELADEFLRQLADAWY
jgi:hypothetical protein